MVAKRWTYLIIGIVYLLAQAGAALHTLHEDAFCAECDSGRVRIQAGGEDDAHHHHQHERHHCRICTGELQAADDLESKSEAGPVCTGSVPVDVVSDAEPVAVHADSRAPPSDLL